MKAQKPPDAAFPAQMITLGDHLRRVRLERKLTQPEVAKMLNVTRDTVFKWEANVCEPLPKFAKSIIAFLGYCPGQGNNPGRQLKKARMISGLTVKEATKVIGCDVRTLMLYESEWFRSTTSTQKKVQAFVEKVFDSPPYSLNGNTKT